MASCGGISPSVMSSSRESVRAVPILSNEEYLRQRPFVPDSCSALYLDPR